MKQFLDMMVPISLLISITGVLVGGFMSLNTIVMNSELILAALVYGLCIGSFNTLNNIFDVRSDMISKPDRPLPSMKMSERTASIFYVLSTLIALIVAYFVNIYLFAFCCIVTLLSVIYSVPPMKLKRVLYLNTLIIAVCYTLIPISAGWLLFSGFQALPWHILIILTMLSFTMIVTKDIQDIHADRIFKVTTIPTLHGIVGSGKFLRKIIILPYSLILLFILTNILTMGYLLTLLPLILAIHLTFYMEKNNKESMGKKFLLEAAAIGLSTEILFMVSYVFL